MLLNSESEQHDVVQDALIATDMNYAKRFRALLRGYGSPDFLQKHANKMAIVILDAATSGRLSVTFYRELRENEYLENILKWHTDTAWPLTYFVLLPKTICTETYLVIGAFDSEEEALNLKAYMETRFFRFLVSQFMFSQHITREAYAFVPVQDFTKEWTDAKLYKKYGIDADEQAFIESVIRPMDGDK